jgi:pimeloyl-ACP methyl ester carboxylesterase
LNQKSFVFCTGSSDFPDSFPVVARPAKLQALPVALQQSNAKRVANSVELDASHSPFLSQPAATAAILAELARA